MDNMSISAVNNLMLQTLTGGNQVKDEKVKEKRTEDAKKDEQERKIELDRQQLLHDINNTEPGHLVDTYA